MPIGEEDIIFNAQTYSVEISTKNGLIELFYFQKKWLVQKIDKIKVV